MSTKIDSIQQELLKQVADLHEIPEGAYNIRANGETASRNSTENIEIVSREDGKGINIHIKDGTVNESVHIPVVISQAGIKEAVYNDFFVGSGCNVTIVAGCGIHNGGSDMSQHDGIHRFFIGEGSRVRYVEKHYGSGEGTGERIMNPQTIIELEKNATMEMESVQIKGVDSTDRLTKGVLADGAKLIVTERLMTHGRQTARSEFDIVMNGKGSGTNVASRSVARDESYQLFVSRIVGNEQCAGHSECDAIIIGNGKVSAVPEVTANSPDAELIHEAAIGKIAGEQIVKLMTLGLSEAEAEEQIVNGFLK